MKYKNKIMLYIKEHTIIAEEFNEWLNLQGDYYIIDIDMLAQDLGQQIIEKFKDSSDTCTWDNISAFVEDTLDEIRGDLQYEVEEYLTNNWK